MVTTAKTRRSIRSPDPDTVRLAPGKTKCPKNYVQNPPKSGICVRKPAPAPRTANASPPSHTQNGPDFHREPDRGEPDPQGDNQSGLDNQREPDTQKDPKIVDPQTGSISPVGSYDRKTEAALLVLPPNRCPKGFTRRPAKTGNCVRTVGAPGLQTRRSQSVSAAPLPGAQFQGQEKEQAQPPAQTPYQPQAQAQPPYQLQAQAQAHPSPPEKDQAPPQPRPIAAARTVHIPSAANLFDSEKKEYETYLSEYALPSGRELTDLDDMLYPEQNDPLFNLKIANKKEFADTRYNGTVSNVAERADVECAAPFEILPNQQFIKNFLSPETPYNGMILVHELGTGKTCSALGVTEQARLQSKMVSNAKKILVIASPNVQTNFRVQLFDFSKLVEVGGKGTRVWDIDSCVGGAILAEINPNPAVSRMTASEIERRVTQLIDSAYEFIGYEALANYIADVAKISDYRDRPTLEDRSVASLKAAFDGRLVVIDEAHNISGRDDTETKKVAVLIQQLVRTCSMKLLLLTATPMYNSYREIIWLTNVLNANDRRAEIDWRQVFTETGAFVEPTYAPTDLARKVPLTEGGRDLLQRKLAGYVSFVRGETPYVFPFRIYPSLFAPLNRQVVAPPTPTTTPNLPKSQGQAQGETQGEVRAYPKTQLNGRPITVPIRYVQVYANTIGSYQKTVYLENIAILNRSEIDNFEEKESFGYKQLATPISLLNMVYPSVEVYAARAKNGTITPALIRPMYGISGLDMCVSYTSQEVPVPRNFGFKYRDSLLQSHGKIFSPPEIGKYSAKIAEVCDIIRRSVGTVLVYSKYIGGGLVPMALALESMGLERVGFDASGTGDVQTLPLFETPPVPVGAGKKRQRYMMITGDRHYSQNNRRDLEYFNNPGNMYGAMVRVVLISDSGAEGLDFKCLRQIHILDAWYNMNRIEQTIGRAVRNKSHCRLPLAERNVEIYMHCTLIDEVETVDLYMYRLAERKALIIGGVVRLLKETAVDCLLNHAQTNFSEAKMNQKLVLTLSTDQKRIEYVVGDKPFTSICDYMATCDFKCSAPGIGPLTDPVTKASTGSYVHRYLQANHSRISKRIRAMFREQVQYSFRQIRAYVNAQKEYPIEQIYYSLTVFLRNKAEWLVNRFGARGYMVYVAGSGEQTSGIYAFQPLIINDPHASIYDRTVTAPNISSQVVVQGIAPTVGVPNQSVVDQSVANQSVTIQSVVDQNSRVADTNPVKQSMSRPEEANGLPPDAPEPELNAMGILAELRNSMSLMFSAEDSVSTAAVAGQPISWYAHAQTVVDILQTKHGVSEYECMRAGIYHFLDTLRLHQKVLLLTHLFSNEESIRKYMELSGKIVNSNANEASLDEITRVYFAEKMVVARGKQTGIVLADCRGPVRCLLFSATSTGTGSKEVGSKVTGINDGTTSFSWVDGSAHEAEWTAPLKITTQLVDEMNNTLDLYADKTKPAYFVGYIGAADDTHPILYRLKTLTNGRVNPGATLEQKGRVNVIQTLNAILPPGELYPEKDKSALDKYALCVSVDIISRYQTRLRTHMSASDREKMSFQPTRKLFFVTCEQYVASNLDRFVVSTLTVLGKSRYVYSSKDL